MADISKCKGTNCPHKEKCYRFTAPSNDLWQSHFSISPYNKTTDECDYFWADKTKTEK